MTSFWYCSRMLTWKHMLTLSEIIFSKVGNNVNLEFELLSTFERAYSWFVNKSLHVSRNESVLLFLIQYSCFNLRWPFFIEVWCFFVSLKNIFFKNYPIAKFDLKLLLTKYILIVAWILIAAPILDISFTCFSLAMRNESSSP